MQKKALLFIPGFLCAITFLAAALSFAEEPGSGRAAEGVLAVVSAGLTAAFCWLAIKPSRAEVRIQKLDEELKAALSRISSIDEWPVVQNPVSIMLRNGEICYFQKDAAVAITKNEVVGRTGGYGGMSFRVAKGITLHSGKSAGKVVRENVQYTYRGILSITNQRFIMTGEKGFEQPVEKLTAISPYGLGAGVMLQFGKSNYAILMRTPYMVPRLCELMRAGFPEGAS